MLPVGHSTPPFVLSSVWPIVASYARLQDTSPPCQSYTLNKLSLAAALYYLPSVPYYAYPMIPRSPACGYLPSPNVKSPSMHPPPLFVLNSGWPIIKTLNDQLAPPITLIHEYLSGPCLSTCLCLCLNNSSQQLRAQGTRQEVGHCIANMR